MKNEKVLTLVEGAVMVALATVLSFVKIVHLPWGGIRRNRCQLYGYDKLLSIRINKTGIWRINIYIEPFLYG